MIARIANQKMRPMTIVGVTEKIAFPQKSSGMNQEYVGQPERDMRPIAETLDAGAAPSGKPEHQNTDREARRCGEHHGAERREVAESRRGR